MKKEIVISLLDTIRFVIASIKNNKEKVVYKIEHFPSKGDFKLYYEKTMDMNDLEMEKYHISKKIVKLNIIIGQKRKEFTSLILDGVVQIPIAGETIVTQINTSATLNFAYDSSFISKEDIAYRKDIEYIYDKLLSDLFSLLNENIQNFNSMITAKENTQ